MPVSVIIFLSLCGICGYFLGSIPFGLLFTRMAGLGDIRKIGSGNIGATNVLRTGRKDLALLTLICDSGKAALAAAAGMYLAPEGYSHLAGLLAGTAGVLGHNFPLWLKFKGGKGVASTLGVILVTAPFTGLLCCITWLVMAFTFRYSSLAALTAMVLAPVYAFFFSSLTAVGFFLFLALLSLLRHRANIDRLLKGTESKIGAKKS
ncbi:MAG: glycerol-3-phosphate 1-O-acyltransferase PlsY [Alphaproteobacteria bacterium]|nr:glycerol-3-phosphate 1-O-acyltransferase PlsY [Alphaproteobacteria bacterium]